MKYMSLCFLLSVLLLGSCKIKDYQSSSRPVTHEIWDSLLHQYVTEEGQVNYDGFIEDSIQFNQYLALLENNHPNPKHWNEQERLAYWLNVYNAFTVKIVIDHYPVDGIKDIKNGIPFVNTVWDIKFINIEGANYDLNNIEHGIMRKKFEEPRIHFAANCASVSCPRLRNEAYTAEKLDAQLEDQANYFLRNPVKNKITTNKLKLSKIFKWYGGDFKKKYGNVRGFLKKYAPAHEGGADIDYLDYDWNLNDGK